MTLSRRSLLSLIGATALGSCRQRKQVVTVFSAASLEDALTEVARAFAHPIAFHFASSGLLARQLQATPRADLFFSASSEQLDQLERAGRLVPNSRRDLLSNRLVAVVKKSSKIRCERPHDLASADFRHLALGDPASVPAGKYAEQLLMSLRSGGASVWQAVGPRRLPMPDVRAALAQAERRDDVVALVYRTDARHSDRVRVLFEVPPELGPRIVCPFAQVAGGPNPAGGRALAEHLLRPEPARIFERHGFGVLP